MVDLGHEHAALRVLLDGAQESPVEPRVECDIVVGDQYVVGAQVGGGAHAQVVATGDPKVGWAARDHCVGVGSRDCFRRAVAGAVVGDHDVFRPRIHGDSRA